tara:strand:+ start:1819 stop:2013 length:195 start_codon:yes stop_codon:yes gene_type:complete
MPTLPSAIGCKDLKGLPSKVFSRSSFITSSRPLMHKRPKMIVSDYSSGLGSNAILSWADRAKVE